MHGARADHDGVTERAQPVRVPDITRAADPLRRAGSGGDTPIQRLRQPPDHAAGQHRPEQPIRVAHAAVAHREQCLPMRLSAAAVHRGAMPQSGAPG